MALHRHKGSKNKTKSKRSQGGAKSKGKDHGSHLSAQRLLGRVQSRTAAALPSLSPAVSTGAIGIRAPSRLGVPTRGVPRATRTAGARNRGQARSAQVKRRNVARKARRKSGSRTAPTVTTRRR